MKALLVLVSLAPLSLVIGCKPPDCSTLSDLWVQAKVGIITGQATAGNCLCPELGGPPCPKGPGVEPEVVSPDAGESAGAVLTISDACIACLRSCSGPSAGAASLSSCLGGACASDCPGGS